MTQVTPAADHAWNLHSVVPRLREEARRDPKEVKEQMAEAIKQFLADGNEITVVPCKFLPMDKFKACEDITAGAGC